MYIAVTTDAIAEFWHSNNLVLFPIISIQASTAFGAFTASNAFRVPSFADIVEANIFFDANADATARDFYYRPTGSSDATGVGLGGTDEDVIEYHDKDTILYVGTGKTIDIKAAGTAEIALRQRGYYLPEGI